MKTTLPFLAFALVAAIGCGSDSNSGSAALTAEAGPAPAHVAHLEIFVMSKCPYGVQVEDALVGVKEKLGPALDLSIGFIGQGDADSLTSMHGPDEVAGDIAQVCAAQQLGHDGLDLVACQNKNVRSVATNWRTCAAELGMDVAALSACVEGDTGKKLLADAFATAAARGAHGSPTIFLDGQPYAGGRKTNDFLRAICATFGDDAPQACADIPKPPRVDAIFLSDARCEKCDLHGLEPKLRGTLGGLQVTYVDYSSAEGQALYADLEASTPGFGLLPTVLLASNAQDDTEGYPALKRYVRPAGAYLELRLGGRFDPTAEICDNGVDDDGNGQSDCADAGCAADMGCREEMPQKLDLYVMSHCPYGAKALIATHDVLPHFGDDMDLTVHFIGGGGSGGAPLSSMHGQAEVDDDLREICVQEHYPEADTFMAFSACISRDYKNADWKACAAEADVDPKVVQDCFDGEGKALLAKSFADTAALGIGSSPTFLVNNKRTFNAIAAPDLQRQFCADNAGLAGCDAVVEADAAASAPDAACGD